MLYLDEVLSHQENQTPPKKPEVIESSNWAKDYVQKHKWLIPINSKYLLDNFNFTGLNAFIENYQFVLKMIRSQLNDIELTMINPQIEQSGEILYSLIHARYILTIEGAQEMLKKFNNGDFGFCRRISCHDQRLLPIGLSYNYGDGNAKLFCPCCQDIYDSDSELDGSAFGLYFPQYFIKINKDLKVNYPLQTQLNFQGILIDPESDLNRSHYVH